MIVINAVRYTLIHSVHSFVRLIACYSFSSLNRMYKRSFFLSFFLSFD